MERPCFRKPEREGGWDSWEEGKKNRDEKGREEEKRKAGKGGGRHKGRMESKLELL